MRRASQGADAQSLRAPQVLVRTECLSHSSEEEGGQKKIIGTAFQTSHKRNHRSYTIEEYEKIALRRFQEYFNHKDPPPDEDTVESEFWYTTSTANNVSMQYANDVEGTACGPDFGPFRPSELPGHAGSPLGLDTEPMPGITSTMMYIGMVHAHFCWHYEDNALCSVNYQHEGSTKTWYVVPGHAAADLENAVKNAFKRMANTNSPLFKDGEQMLIRKTIMMSPSILMAAGVPVFKIHQHPREFIITFPRGYHSGFNHGFHIGEAVNIALSSWIPYALTSLDRYRALGTMSCLDVIRCVCTAARILVSQGPPPLDTPSQPADTIISQGPPPADIQGPPSDILLSQPPLPSDASNAAHEAEGAGGSSAARTAPAILAGEGSGAAGRPMLGNGEGDAPLLEVQNGPQRPGAVEGGGVGEERRAGAGGQG
ncbi:JmjC domain, hydroxylase-domain-containing protein, partial [Baffinella frigidus]